MRDTDLSKKVHVTFTVSSIDANNLNVVLVFMEAGVISEFIIYLMIISNSMFDTTIKKNVILLEITHSEPSLTTDRKSVV